MTAGGHIMDMMNRIRQNAALKISHRNKFKANNRKINFSKNEQLKPQYDFPKISESKLKREATKEHHKQHIYWVLFAIGVLVIFMIFNYYYYPHHIICTFMSILLLCYIN